MVASLDMRTNTHQLSGAISQTPAGREINSLGPRKVVEAGLPGPRGLVPIQRDAGRGWPGSYRLKRSQRRAILRHPM